MQNGASDKRAAGVHTSIPTRETQSGIRSLISFASTSLTVCGAIPTNKRQGTSADRGIEGVILEENEKMLELCKRQGFRRSSHADEPGSVHITLTISPEIGS